MKVMTLMTLLYKKNPTLYFALVRQGLRDCIPFCDEDQDALRKLYTARLHGLSIRLDGDRINVGDRSFNRTELANLDITNLRG